MTQQVIPHPDAGSRKGKALETVAGITYANNFASITGYRIKCGMTRQVTPHPDAGSRKEKALETVADITYANNFASIPGYRVVARYGTLSAVRNGPGSGVRSDIYTKNTPGPERSGSGDFCKPQVRIFLISLLITGMTPFC